LKKENLDAGKFLPNDGPSLLLFASGEGGVAGREARARDRSDLHPGFHERPRAHCRGRDLAVPHLRTPRLEEDGEGTSFHLLREARQACSEGGASQEAHGRRPHPEGQAAARGRLGRLDPLCQK